MNKREAAEYLGTTTRSIESYVNKGKLNPKKVPGPTGPSWVFDREELEVLKAQREALAFAPVAALTAPARKTISTGVISDPLEMLHRLVEGLSRNRPGAGATTAATGKVVLTRDEIVELGIPRTVLKRALSSGELRSFGRGATLRVNAEDFDAWRLAQAEATEKLLQEPTKMV